MLSVIGLLFVPSIYSALRQRMSDIPRPLARTPRSPHPHYFVRFIQYQVFLGETGLAFFSLVDSPRTAPVWFAAWYATYYSSADVIVPLVGRTHTIVRLQTRIRRKDGTENFGGFVYVLDGFLPRNFVLWVFMCLVNFSLSFPATAPRATTPQRLSFPATTPRATTPQRSLFRLPRRGLPRPYRYIQDNRLPRLQGYHTRAITLQTNFWVQAGYHTCG